MKHFEKQKNVFGNDHNIQVIDGSQKVAILTKYLKPGSSVLEIGMGLGNDLKLLQQYYKVTGSDISWKLLDLFRFRHPDFRLLMLDAVTLETSLSFDCIYSNKVLHHLSENELNQSFLRQYLVLNPKGILCHALWYGNKKVVAKKEVFHYYTENTLKAIIGKRFKTLLTQRYTEMVENDSLLVILEKC